MTDPQFVMICATVFIAQALPPAWCRIIGLGLILVLSTVEILK